ncbi:1-(5-phosphoribosyl)-5-[(5-phosphoribosylamino)methylideneamino]imidazole-4-carboxamide isomerase [Candidatus Sumerlaeota bacterium]|nr:1-(5-phosphoribosyl)-5-[(5-phosphoribosylamino)methylideneamino]imidazole-4-carboxamide isomerase [Candidatus Sumerlaeota bacterium]
MNSQSFLIIPAIDLMDGKAVRLRQGEADKKTIFSDNPADVARQFAGAGAKRIHLVDLDGAFGGKPKNLPVIEQIRAAVDCELELGGGLRTHESIQAALDAGINDAILGTAAAEHPDLFAALAGEFAPNLIAGIDARDGIVVTRGWVQTVDGLPAVDLARQAIQLGVRRVIYTDVATDGMMRGPNLARLQEMAAIEDIEITASGGVTQRSDLEDILALKQPSITGAIVGRAIYEGAIDLKNAIEVCQHG